MSGDCQAKTGICVEESFSFVPGRSKRNDQTSLLPDRTGYGWGMTSFASLTLQAMPAEVFFSLLNGWSDALPTIVAFVCDGEHGPVTRAIPIGIDVVEVQKIKVLFDSPDLFPAVTVLGKQPPRDASVFLFELCCDQIDMLGFTPIFQPEIY
jgi:hypothetical protein